MKNILKPVLDGNFLNELRLDIQVEVCALAPGNLKDIMLVTQQIENKIHSLQDLGVGHKIRRACIQLT